MLENAGKQEENGGKLCQPFAGVLLGIGVKMVSSFFAVVGFQGCRRCFEGLVSGLVSSFLENYYPFAGKF